MQRRRPMMPAWSRSRTVPSARKGIRTPLPTVQNPAKGHDREHERSKSTILGVGMAFVREFLEPMGLLKSRAKGNDKPRRSRDCRAPPPRSWRYPCEPHRQRRSARAESPPSLGKLCLRCCPRACEPSRGIPAPAARAHAILEIDWITARVRQF